MLELKNINKSFGSLQVLDNVSATFGRGEVVSIVGPSGAGKTTLLQIAGTLDKPDSGSVVYDGVDVSAMPERKLSEFRNKRIGFVFQFHQLLPEFTALENVAIPALIHGESRSKAQARAKDLLEMLGLASRADHKPMELSGGEKQRVAVARALINNPDVTDSSSCIVVKESFGNAFVPFLTDHYQTIHVIDYRYWKGSLSQCVTENNVQDVLFVNNLSAIRSTALVGYLHNVV